MTSTNVYAAFITHFDLRSGRPDTRGQIQNEGISKHRSRSYIKPGLHKRRKNKLRNKHKNKSSCFTVKTTLMQEQEVKQAQAKESKLFLFLALALMLVSTFFS